MAKCKECGDELKREGKICSKCRTALYYEHSELRFVMWNLLKHHGTPLAKEIYSLMVEEDGEEWTKKALGSKLVLAIHGSV